MWRYFISSQARDMRSQFFCSLVSTFYFSSYCMIAWNDFLVFYCPKMRMNLINWPTLWDDLTTDGNLYYFHLFQALKLISSRGLKRERKTVYLFFIYGTKCVQLFHTIPLCVCVCVCQVARKFGFGAIDFHCFHSLSHTHTHSYFY